VGQKPTRIGIRQLIVSTLFTLVFIITWQIKLISLCAGWLCQPAHNEIFCSVFIGYINNYPWIQNDVKFL